MRFAMIMVLVSALGSGCAHTMIVETEPNQALVSINDKPLGEAPVVTTQFTSTGGRLYVVVEAEGYERERVVVEQKEWFLWPAVLAVTPLLGVPFVVIPILGPIITIGWAIVSSPTLLSLLFLQKYPERVRVQLRPKIAGGVLVPTDSWLIPDDMDPNPPPLSDKPPDTSDVPKQPPQPEGGNPVP